MHHDWPARYSVDGERLAKLLERKPPGRVECQHLLRALDARALALPPLVKKHFSTRVISERPAGLGATCSPVYFGRVKGRLEILEDGRRLRYAPRQRIEVVYTPEEGRCYFRRYRHPADKWRYIMPEDMILPVTGFTTQDLCNP